MDLLNNSNQSFQMSGNLTDDVLRYRQHLKEACDIMSVVVLMMIMLAMGADISFRHILDHFRRPVGISIGMLCQFVVMPLVGFSHIRALGVEGPYAVGVLLISCCPGGAVSNVFTYFIDGDVPLSVAMTSTSTLFALGFMPLNIWIYGRWIEVGDLVIPYKSIATSLVFVTAPALFGMLIKLKFKKTAVYITKVGSLLGFFLIAVVIVLQNVAYPQALKKVHLRLAVAVVTMPIAGMALGYCLTWALRQEQKVRKTVAVESSVQNVAVAISVLVLSRFSFEEYGCLMVFPMMYAMSMILLGSVVSLMYNLFAKVFYPSKADEKSGLEMKKTPTCNSVESAPKDCIQMNT